MNAPCPFCGTPTDPVRDTWIGRGQAAHSECAWLSEDSFWSALDAIVDGILAGVGGAE